MCRVSNVSTQANGHNSAMSLLRVGVALIKINLLHKPCTKCKKDKDYRDFYGNAYNKTGRQSHCIDCVLDGPMKSRKLTRRVKHERQLKHHFAMTIEEYDALFKKQDGVCAICKRPETKIDSRSGIVRNLSVDHCHITNRNRGLLCFACNTGIGSLQEDQEVLRTAIDYLDKWRMIIEIDSDSQTWIQVKHVLRESGYQYYLQEHLFNTNKTLFLEPRSPEPEGGELVSGLIVYQGGSGLNHGFSMDSRVFAEYQKETAS